MKKVQNISFYCIFFYITALGISISSMIEITIFSTQECNLDGSGLVLVPSAGHKTWLNWDELAKAVVMCHNRCGTLKIPPCSNAVGAKHMSKTYSPLPRFHMSEIFYSRTLNNLYRNRQTRKNTTKAFSTGHIQCQIHSNDF